MTKLLWVVFKPDLQVIEATIEDATGKRRRIDLKWHTRDRSGPPSNWWELVCAEVDFQLSDRGLF